MKLATSLMRKAISKRSRTFLTDLIVDQGPRSRYCLTTLAALQTSSWNTSRQRPRSVRHCISSRIKFAVYAFSTDKSQVKCWVVKPPNIKWSVVSARRLAQIKASGGTPLAEVYGMLEPVLKSFKPDILVTMTDGEPSDFDAVRTMVLSYRKMGVRMVAIGVGRNVNDSVEIGHNLKYLTYEKAISVSRLQDIPKKVIKLLKS